MFIGIVEPLSLPRTRNRNRNRNRQIIMWQQALVCNCNYSSPSSKPSSLPVPLLLVFHSHSQIVAKPARRSRRSLNTTPLIVSNEDYVVRTSTVCHASRRKTNVTATSSSEDDDNLRRVLQFLLWVAEGVYILYLFLLPYAPVTMLLIHFPFFFSQPNCLVILKCNSRP